MTSAGVLEDAYTRIHDRLHNVLDGLSVEQLTWRIGPTANTIGWLAWHISRVQDDSIAHLAGEQPIWTSAGWATRFALPFDDGATGYGQSAQEVGAVAVSAELLTGYHDAVYERTARWVRTLTDADLPRVVDTRYDPPVTLAVRLVSLIADGLEHVGQAAYLRGQLP